MSAPPPQKKKKMSDVWCWGKLRLRNTLWDNKGRPEMEQWVWLKRKEIPALSRQSDGIYIAWLICVPLPVVPGQPVLSRSPVRHAGCHRQHPVVHLRWLFLSLLNVRTIHGVVNGFNGKCLWSACDCPPFILSASMRICDIVMYVFDFDWTWLSPVLLQACSRSS